MAPNPEATRRVLLDAAERLFAERGIDAVSLREINAAAGSRNATALQYHFGDRRGLVKAVVARHRPGIDARRHELLDEYEAAGVRDLRVLAGTLVRPEAELLRDASGRCYLRIAAELVNRPDVRLDPTRPPDLTASTDRWRTLVGPLLPDVAVRRLHHRFTAIRLSAVELARRAGGPVRRDDRLFVSHLVDLITALLDTPISEETAALLAARRRS